MSTFVLIIKAIVLAMQTFHKGIELMKDRNESERIKFYNEARAKVDKSLETIKFSQDDGERLDAGEDLEDTINDPTP
jgi:hypothetical protein